MSEMMREYKQQRRRMFRERNRKKVYISAYYGGDVEKSMSTVRRYCRKAVEEGSIPFAPNLYFSQFMSDDDPEERQLRKQFGLSFLRYCDELWCFGKPTRTMESEIAEATRLGLKIVQIEQ